MMKTKILRLLIWILLFCPRPLGAEVYQWTDARGTIHFTDNLHSVPASFRDSPRLTIHRESSIGGTFSEILTQTGTTRQEPVSEEKAPASVSAPEPTQTPQPVINYNPQYTTIVVVNSIVLHHPKKRSTGISENGRPAFQPSFDDRRFIHPSVFSGGSRQYIHPELFPSSRR